MKYLFLRWVCGIVLALATTACTGLGVQAGPTLTSQIFQEQGLGSLWGEVTDEAPEAVVRVERRDDTALGDLWMEADGKSDWNGDSTEEAPRATAILEKLTLTHSDFAVGSNRL